MVVAAVVAVSVAAVAGSGGPVLLVQARRALAPTPVVPSRAPAAPITLSLCRLSPGPPL
jgi:hypothetical protein